MQFQFINLRKPAPSDLEELAAIPAARVYFESFYGKAKTPDAQQTVTTVAQTRKTLQEYQAQYGENFRVLKMSYYSTKSKRHEEDPAPMKAFAYMAYHIMDKNKIGVIDIETTDGTFDTQQALYKRFVSGNENMTVVLPKKLESLKYE